MRITKRVCICTYVHIARTKAVVVLDAKTPFFRFDLPFAFNAHYYFRQKRLLDIENTVRKREAFNIKKKKITKASVVGTGLVGTSSLKIHRPGSGGFRGHIGATDCGFSPLMKLLLYFPRRFVGPCLP